MTRSLNEGADVEAQLKLEAAYAREDARHKPRLHDFTGDAPRNPDFFVSEMTPVAIIQREWEFAKLLEFYRLLMPRRVLEIGTAAGGTLYHWLRNAPSGAIVVSVDEPQEQYGSPDNSHLYADWAPLDVECVAIKRNSKDAETVSLVAAYAPYDFCFIDGDHAYEGVKADWENYRPMVKSGGVVAFHDIVYHQRQPNVKVDKLWQRIQKQGYVTQEIVGDSIVDIPDWGGIGLVWIP